MVNYEEYEAAWHDILESAESVLEDDVNEDGMPEEAYGRHMSIIWAILANPWKFIRMDVDIDV